MDPNSEATRPQNAENDTQEADEEDDTYQDLDKVKLATDLLERLQVYMETMSELQVDDHEYACLRGLCLFGADISPAHNRKRLCFYQQKCVQVLRNNIHNAASDEDDR